MCITVPFCSSSHALSSSVLLHFPWQFLQLDWKVKPLGKDNNCQALRQLLYFVKARKKRSTLFENYSKCRIWVYEFWHFPPIFVLLKLTCLVTLFDRKLQVFKNSPKWNIFGHFQLTFVHSKCKHNSLCSQRWMRLFLWFSNTVEKVWKACF